MDLEIYLVLADIKCYHLSVGKAMVRSLISSRLCATPELDLPGLTRGRRGLHA